LKLIDYKSKETSVAPLHYECFAQEIAGKSLDFGNMAINYVEMPKEGYADPHYHPHSEHIYLVLEGEMIVNNGKEVITVSAGQAAYVEKGEPHKVTSNGRDDIKYFIITVPPGEFIPAEGDFNC
jgi:quercetin dioxygenase-like cupin family protein